MRPGEAVRQIEYVIDATTTDGGRRCAAGYRPAFERVHAAGDGDDVADLAAALGDEVRDGARPDPAAAGRVADELLGVATDGGS
ncbi:hypothetical protein [Halobaculum rubrum]|uniref:hypothetical protein n=1 Tax=Halobaculum rubrum TaxID=2872158 RepID=UPI001CA3D694|nr:hypothetical protein [Halobaculum rubrum]QZX99576.1 hypothetical protein K6T25_00220 [Halobaculum rubrum]